MATWKCSRCKTEFKGEKEFASQEIHTCMKLIKSLTTTELYLAVNGMKFWN